MIYWESDDKNDAHMLGFLGLMGRTMLWLTDAKHWAMPSGGATLGRGGDLPSVN